MTKKPIKHGGNYSDGSDALFKRFYVEVQHLPSRKSLYFKAMLTQFEDQYTSDWATEQVFGRMDPVRTFRGTQRIISLGWDVVAASLEEAQHNLKSCSEFLSMLYPSYDGGTMSPDNVNAAVTTESDKKDNKETQKRTGDIVKPRQGQGTSNTGNAATIKSAPLFRIKFANLVQSTRATETNDSIESGLIGSIDGLTYAPDLEAGFFDPISEGNALYPQTIKLAFGFTVAHDHPLGWTAVPTGKDESKGSLRYGNVFPYTGKGGGDE
jgi:hypothetical protein